ncbi:hypothetical protein C2G38_2201128 [Gigaspora rosea]|uniref:Uncharacterized protein n=1 Tax=Gigaspora rosea TaxID=44941 RepID=A0A397UPW7_9GLOM|nr:hypothetical protein C2G38_2201128 [Gigaspora rosea]
MSPAFDRIVYLYCDSYIKQKIPKSRGRYRIFNKVAAQRNCAKTRNGDIRSYILDA